MRLANRWFRLAAACAALLVAAPLVAQAPPKDASNQDFGEVIDIRTGFVRVTLPAGVPPPSPEDFEVVWRKQPQKVVRVVGGASDPIEVGLAVDRSASMHETFEPMRKAALDLVDQGISEKDRVFTVSFTNETRLLAEGRGQAARVLSQLPAQPETGTRPTAFFDALSKSLQLFENADARAALLVLSDGCDTSGGLMSATSVARRAADLAIPIFLLLPTRNDCQNTRCVQDLHGEWNCKAEAAPVILNMESNAMFNPAERQTGLGKSSTASGATAERDRFTGLITAGGGGDYVVNDPKDFEKALDKIFTLLSRQWTVVFEPSSTEVTSEEVKVYLKTGNRRKKLN